MDAKNNRLCTNDCPCSSKLNLYKELHMVGMSFDLEVESTIKKRPPRPPILHPGTTSWIPLLLLGVFRTPTTSSSRSTPTSPLPETVVPRSQPLPGER